MHWSAGIEELANDLKNTEKLYVLKSFFTQIALLNLSLTLTNKMILIAFPFTEMNMTNEVALDEAQLHNFATQHTLYVKPFIAKHLLV